MKIIKAFPELSAHGGWGGKPILCVWVAVFVQYRWRGIITLFKFSIGEWWA